MSCVLPRNMPSLQTEPRPHAHHGAHRLRVLGKINRLAECQLRVQMLQGDGGPGKDLAATTRAATWPKDECADEFFREPRDRSVPSATSGSFCAICRMESYSSSERPSSITAFARALMASFRNALLVGGGRRGYPLLIILLETGHPLYGGSHRIELLVRNIRRLVGETGRRRLDLSVCCGNGEKPHGN